MLAAKSAIRSSSLVGLLALSLILSACGASSTTPPGAPTSAAPTSASTSGPVDQPTAQPSLEMPTLDTASAVPGATQTLAPTNAPATTAPTGVPTGIPGTGNAQAIPNPDVYAWKQVYTGLSQPIGLAVAGDGSGRVFIVEKGGQILIGQNGQLAGQPYLDIRDRVGSRGSEQGLLGLAFDPQYQQNGRFYVNYTDQNGNTVISRFNVSANDPNQGDPGSEQVLLQQQQPFPNHNGGQLAFGPDGYLYLGLGDGGSGGDPQNNGQSLDTYLGKILRIDVHQGDTYTIPPDNPFVNTNHKAEIWAYGLRNPWRFSFDTKTGDLYIADVGQDQWEEIDYLPAGTPGGTDFGWSIKEATHDFKGSPPAGAKLVDPVYEYSHDQGCSVTGGYVYRGPSLPEWQGVYLFGDYCSGRVWGLLKTANGWQSQQLYDTSYAISSFGQDEAGEVYLIDVNGNVLQLVKK